ncbi:Kelch repeat-containing protein [Winogradskyella jejuensis]|nr:kelch repeat-containing protein [Winogradskyella jejuensis]
MKKTLKFTNLLMFAVLLISFSCSDDDSVEITLEDLTVTIDENPLNGQIIGTVEVMGTSSPDFSISSQTPNGALNIDASSGELTVADAALFDFETNPVITATISAIGTSNTAAVTINLLDTHEALTGQFSEVTVTGNIFSARWRHQVVSFNNKIWVIGGEDTSGRKNDIWSSTDGITWQEETPIGNHFSERTLHTAIVFDDKIWVIGGRTIGNSLLNDVWSSPDGVTWTQVGNVPLFIDTASLTVFENKLWLVGGRTAGSQNNSDIFSTSDGITWDVETTTGSLFSPRFLHQAFVLNNKLFVTGGNDNSTVVNDTWSSTDGTNWLEENSNSNIYSPRYYHNTFVKNNDTVFLIGGASGSTGANYKDLWTSIDGVNWLENVDVFPAGYSVRRGQQTVFHNDTIIVIGGNSGSSSSSPTLLNDVWKYDF